MPSLFKALGPPQAQAPAAPGAPGIAAVPQNPAMQPHVDPALAEFMSKNPGLPEVVAKAAFEASQSRGHMFPPSAPAPAVSPFQNYANKATGKDYK